MSRTQNDSYDRNDFSSSEDDLSSSASSSISSICSSDTSGSTSIDKAIPRSAKTKKELLMRKPSTDNSVSSSAANMASFSKASVNSSVNTANITFECSVCLEPLDHPASIELKKKDNAVNLTDILVTRCGHLFHLACMETWFAKQRRRTCPSCRKCVPNSKCIRLHPNITQDAARRCKEPDTFVTNLTKHQLNTRLSCQSAYCQELKVIHNTLISDYEDLQKRFYECRKDNELRTATNRSLEDEINRLKGQLEKNADASETKLTSSSGSTSKRQRKH